jgi:hypothetical protein
MVKNGLRPNYGHIALWSQRLTAFAPGAALTFNAGVAAGAALTFRAAPEGENGYLLKLRREKPKLNR